MKKIRIVWFIIMCSSFFIFHGCEDPQDSYGSVAQPIESFSAKYQVTFYGNGGNPRFIFNEVSAGDRAVAPENPAWDDPDSEFVFVGWFTELDPAEGTLWDFADPVDEHMHLYAQWLPVLTDIVLIKPYLDEFPDNLTATAHPLILKIDLETTALEHSAWHNVLQEISAADKYVHLDLSASGIVGSEFNGGLDFSVGKINIVSLILPDTAHTVSGFGSPSEEQRFFANLASVSGAGITSINDNAFFGCDSLILLDFPQAQSIGNSTFNGCSSLFSLNFPETTSIGNSAFEGCSNLISVNFPKLSSIGSNAFDGCDNFGRIVIGADSTIAENQEPLGRFDTFRDFYESAGSLMGAYAWSRSIGWAGP